MLLNAHNLDVIDFAAKGFSRPVLSGLLVTPTHTVATDSYTLLQVENPVIPEKDVPIAIVTAWPAGRNDNIIIPRCAIAKAIKNIPKNKTITNLNHVAVDTCMANSEGKVTTANLITTDLETTDKVETRLIDGKFPDYKQILPTEKPIAAIRLSAPYVKRMAGYFDGHATCYGADASLVLELYGSEKACIMRGKTEEGQDILGLVMPQRANDLNNSINPVAFYAEDIFKTLKVLTATFTDEDEAKHNSPEHNKATCALCSARDIIAKVEPPPAPADTGDGSVIELPAAKDVDNVKPEPSECTLNDDSANRLKQDLPY